jgi:hypothetical protein
MRFSEARTSYLAHRIVDMLRREGLAEVEQERHVLMEIKRLLADDHTADTRLDTIVRRKIASLSRNVPPGSREWDILYRQYYTEESRKLKPGP